jgi:hypothetical protein
MYRFSRALFLEIKDLVDPSPEVMTAEEAQRRVLAACEGTVARLASEPRYLTRPARSLFEEIRFYFPISQQARIYYAVERTIALAEEFIRLEQQRNGEAFARCRATTRKGKPCQRTPLPEREYCPSHQHLEERPLAGAAA